MNQEFFSSFSLYPSLPYVNNGVEEFTKNLLMKLSLQNFLINFLTMDSFNDLMLIHRKIDEMLQNLLVRQTPTTFLPMQPPNFAVQMPAITVFKKSLVKFQNN